MNDELATILRKLPAIIESADAIPLFGNAPPFDWHHFSSLLATRFEIKDFSIHPSNQAWVLSEAVKAELHLSHFAASIYLNPISAPCYFVISKADQNKLTTSMMQGKVKAQISEPLKEGFCRFLILEALAAASTIEPIATLTPRLGETTQIPHENAFCIDVEIAFGEHSCWSKLILPASFRKGWIEHFSMHHPAYYNSELAKSTELILDCQCGSVILSQKEWDALEPGDFVLLDQGSFNAQSNTSIVVLKIGAIALFQARISQNAMELLDYALTQEEIVEQESQGGAPLPPVEEENISIQNIPLNICVELARLRISLDHLMHLHPGNMLTLPIHPDQGVVLTVNGKKVGRAELLYLGESLGIRILELG